MPKKSPVDQNDDFKQYVQMKNPVTRRYSITENSGKCQEFCIEHACVTFQYTSDTKNCTLMKEDYRQVCKTVGLPNVSFLQIDNKELICLALSNI